MSKSPTKKQFDAETVQNLQQELYDEMCEALSHRKFYKILEKYGVSGDHVITFEYQINSRNFDFEGAEELKALLENTQFLPTDSDTCSGDASTETTSSAVRMVSASTCCTNVPAACCVDMQTLKCVRCPVCS